MSKHAPVTAVEDAGAKVSSIARAVAAQRAALTAIVTSGATIAAAFGVHNAAGWSQYGTTWIERIVLIAGALGGVTWIHQGVTPADPALNPTASDGSPLIRARVAAMTLQALAAHAQPDSDVPESVLAALDADTANILGESGKSGETSAPVTM